MVLSHQPISGVTVLKNNRKPVVRDIVTNTLVSGKAPLHTFPFASPWRFGPSSRNLLPMSVKPSATARTRRS